MRGSAPGRDHSAVRRSFVASQLPSSSWPAQRTLIATVNAETGERTAFDSATGISLLDAVLASDAVAGIYPPIEFRGQHFMVLPKRIAEFWR